MKRFYQYLLLLTLIATSSLNLNAQMVGDNIFLPGHWVEVGIAPNGSLGSTRGAPAGYYPLSPTFTLYDPALGASASVSTALMMVYDHGHDGWTVATPGISPPFMGDYSMPGSPYEGWGIQINGTHSEAQFPFYQTGGASGYSGGTLTGTNTGYTNTGGTLKGVWQGTAASGQLAITQTTKVDTNASWVVISVKLKNTGATALTNIYYDREVDPDNDELHGAGTYGIACPGSFSTTNTINYQNDFAHRVGVTAQATCITSNTLSLITKDCRAKCYIHSAWPISTATSLAAVYAQTAGTSFTYSGTITNDYAIGLVWNLGSIAAGDSTMLSYSYVFDNLTALDSAIANPQLVTLGVAHDSTDTVTACVFTGDTLWATIANGATADWAGSTWTWAPSTGLTATTGTSVGVIMSSVTSVMTYTITGTNSSFGACATRTFKLTVTPATAVPGPAVHDTNFCLGSASGPITACATGSSVKWYTAPTGGVGSSTAPTPSTAVAGTTTYYVTQTIASCESPRIPVNVIINSPPPAIGGSTLFCIGASGTLSDASPGGTWASANTSIATVGVSTGVVTGVATGTTNITYFVGACYTTIVVTVTSSPSAIIGTFVVCSGTTTTFGDPTPGGTWSSSTAAVGTIGAATGAFYGVAAGTTTVTYGLSAACIATTTVTVNTSPVPITGNTPVCAGNNLTLVETSTGGTWSSSITSVATVNPTTGVVAGISAGTSTISYIIGSGCYAVAVVTVNAAPTAFTGPTQVCTGQNITVGETVAGGTWSSSNTTVGTVSTSGVVTGLSAGTTTIDYVLSSGCSVTEVVTVNTVAAITGTSFICTGLTTTLADATPGGAWTTSSSATAPVDAGGVVTGGSPAGTATITYTIASTGCYATRVVTVNAGPAAITGTQYVCTGFNTTLADVTSGGTWISGTGSVGTISTSGVVTGIAPGTTIITYSLGAGCQSTAIVTVNPSPAPIVGTNVICGGSTTTLTDATTPGTWSSSAGASVGAATGIVTGGAGGTPTITYTVPPIGSMTACYAVFPMTVNPLPAVITGTNPICQSSTAVWSNTSTGGTWVSGNTAVAVIDAGGTITGITNGTSVITYTLPTGCLRTRVLTVNVGPAISGSPAVCEGTCTTLTATPTPGTWSSSTPGIATIGSSTGIMCGAFAGNAVITYTGTASGCYSVVIATVYSTPPPITGNAIVCPGITSTLANAVSGGVWSSSGTGTVTVTSGGVITGIALGTATISYVTAGCTATRVVTVTSLPPAITGPNYGCIGATTTYTDGAGAGTWSSSNTAVGTIGTSSGILTGIASGTTTITYTPTGSACYTTKVVTVSALPTISGLASVCIGYTTTLSGTASGGTWSIGAPSTGSATIGASSGVITGVTAGTVTAYYTAPTTGCVQSVIVTVNPLPGAITGTTTLCSGTTTTLSNTSTGGAWSSSNTAVATIGASDGGVLGGSAGTSVISYTIGSGCAVTTTVTVVALPSAISGSTLICVGSSSTLVSTPAGGTWQSSNTSVAPINSSGVVLGSTPGTSNITYTVASGCRVFTTVTVNAVPSNVSYTTLSLCPLGTLALTDATPGGLWSSSNATVADVGSSTGIVTAGSTSGNATISYVVSATGCYKTVVVTVNPNPAPIGGTLVVCAGSATLLTDATPGGSWISGTTSVATIGSGTGIATGASGVTTTSTATITYKMPTTGCQVTADLTVNPLPATITGPFTVCPGTTTTLGNTATGGTWASSNTFVATIGSSTGIVTGNNFGTSVVTYTLPTGCMRTAVVTVNPLPLPIAGAGTTICPNTSTTLSDGTAGGTWSVGGGTGIASISTGGVITGITDGTVIATYTLSTGCYVTATVTINPAPAAISGGSAVCLGLCTTLSDVTSGGTWISSSTSVASVGSSSGVACGVGIGVATITYKLTATGCYATQNMTVNGLPPAIGGTGTMCPGTCTTLSNAASGGGWSATDGTGSVSISPSTGITCGIAAGTATVTYTIGTGCTVTRVVTVNPTPPAITGSLGVCIGFNTTLSNAITGGTWVSSNPSAVTIDAGGVAHGLTVGTSTITYTAPGTGCTITAVVTVNPLPAPITGSVAFCNLTTTTLHDASAGGTWSSADTNIVVIDTFTGEITGHNPGSTLVTYTLPTGCYTTRTQGIILAPYPVTGPDNVCEGYSITLSNVIAGGTWTSSAPGTASIDIDSAYVNGYTAGVATMTYTLSNGCFSSHDVTVNVTPASITGIKQVCYGLQTTLFDATSGGTWSSLDPLTAAIGSSSGVVDGTGPGTTTISYIMPTGCYNTTTVTVNPLPSPIEGSFEICYLSTTILTDSTSGGTWTSSNVGVIMPNPSTGLMAAVGIGTSNITYTLATGCIVTQEMTVDPLPAPITGIFDVCQGLSVTLDDATGTGTWSSSNSLVAPITSGGVVTGGDAGVATITYQLITGCYVTQEVTVNALPPAITGSLMMCAGFATNLSNATPGGIWTTDASSTGIGYLNSITGVVSGIAPGTMNITYTLPSGCLTMAVATINALPEPITGSFKVCVGSTTTLDDPDMGGTWSSSNPAVGSVDFINGVVTGVAAGTTNITYKLLATGCINKAVVTVNPLPSAITGPSEVCENATITLTSATPLSGHAWESMTPSIATIGSFSGIVTGVSAGTVVIRYANSTTLCSVSKVITVNPVPAAIVGPNGVCLSSSVTLTDATTGGTWSSSNPAAAPISSAGVVSGVALGNTIITYKLTSTGCQALKPMTVNALPNLYNVVGGGNYCEGGNGVPISLDGSQIGIGYALYYGSSATGYLTGTGAPLNFGLLTMAGSYHVVATNGITGCSRDMIGTVSVVINPSVVPTIDIHSPSGTDTVCPGGTLLFTVDTTYAGTTPTFLWKVNGVAVSTSPTYTYTPASGDVISVKMTSNANCAVPVTANDTMHVTVLPSAMPVANVLITPGDTVCRFNPTTYNAAATYGGSAPLFTWYVNGSVAGTGPSYTYVPDSLDQVQLMMISNYQCATDDTVYSSLINMVVEPLRIPHVDIVAYPGLYIADGQSDSLVAYATNAGSHPTYQWKVNSIPVPGATNPVYVAVFHDYDSVNCEVTSSDVCHGISSFDWVFINLHPVSVGNVGTAAADLKLLPNPNKGEFTIRGDLGRNVDEEVTLEVTDMLGQVVYNGVARSHKGRVEEQVSLSSTLANGMYLLNLKTTTAHQTFHFVIEK